MRLRTFFVLVLVFVLPLLAVSARADSVLGTTVASYAVLGGSAVNDVPTSTIVGNVGVSPGSSITGLGGSEVTGGTIQPGTQALAHSQLVTAINILNLLGPGTTEGVDLAGLTLIPGVYTVPAGSSNLTGTLTLNGIGVLNPAWVFLMQSTLITSPGSKVIIENADAGAGLFWDVRSSATIDTTTSFEGNILALTAITLNNSATIGCGRALAQNAAVKMNTNTIGGGCSGSLTGSSGLGGGLTVRSGPGGVVTVGGGGISPVTGTIPGTIPEPGTFGLLSFGLALGLLKLRKLR